MGVSALTSKVPCKLMEESKYLFNTGQPVIIPTTIGSKIVPIIFIGNSWEQPLKQQLTAKQKQSEND